MLRKPKGNKRIGKELRQKKHGKRRLRERFGISLSDRDYEDLVNKIQNDETTYVEKQSCRISVFDVKLLDEVVRVVYDKSRKTIVTALFPTSV